MPTAATDDILSCHQVDESTNSAKKAKEGKEEENNYQLFCLSYLINFSYEYSLL